MVSPNFCTSSWLRCCHITVRWWPLKVGLPVLMSLVRSVAVQVRPRISTFACTAGGGQSTIRGYVSRTRASASGVQSARIVPYFPSQPPSTKSDCPVT